MELSDGNHGMRFGGLISSSASHYVNKAAEKLKVTPQDRGTNRTGLVRWVTLTPSLTWSTSREGD